MDLEYAMTKFVTELSNVKMVRMNSTALDQNLKPTLTLNQVKCVSQRCYVYTRAHVQEDTRLSHRRAVSAVAMEPRANLAWTTSLTAAMVSASPLTDNVTVSETVTTWRTRPRVRGAQ